MKTKSKPKKVKLVGLVTVTGRWAHRGHRVVALGLDSTGELHGVVVEGSASGVLTVLAPNAEFSRLPDFAPRGGHE